MNQKVVLIITDGIGFSPKTEYNAFHHAKKPHYDYLFKSVPNSLVCSYGEEVGLPHNQMGNSEVGHISLGSGRVIHQDLVRINKAIANKELESNPALRRLLDSINTLHLLILASKGGVHSHIDHLEALALLAKKEDKKIWLHLISDGRDTGIQTFMEHTANIRGMLDSTMQIATISGRFYAMDRDKRWDRVKLAFDCIAKGANPKNQTVESYIEENYEQGIFDEFIPPASFNGYTGLPVATQALSKNFIDAESMDSQTEGLVFVNYRSDRARQLSASLGLRDFDSFERKLPNISMACLCEYDETFPFAVLFPKDKLDNTLPQILARAGLSQARVAETEKYAHVTFFFNGGREEPLEGEERLLVPSPKVKTYDLKPEMSASEVGDGVCDFIERGFDFIAVNFANGDMVGHTGNFEASIKAVEAVDKELAKIWNLAKQKGYSLVLTSDHGNCEEMKDSKLRPLTNHTVGDVFCFVDSDGVSKINNGRLSNIAPTILKIMGLPLPKEMDAPLF